MKDSKILPLRGLNLNSKPLNHRAIAWSCDAELAVAADDSLIIFLPEFPLLDPNDEDQDEDESMVEDDPTDMQVQDGYLSSRLPKQYGEGDDDDEDRLEEDSEDDDIEPAQASQTNGAGKPGSGGDDTHKAATRANIDPLDTSDPRRQFFDGMRHFPVSWPFLSADLNAHVWEAAGRQMPLLHTNVRDHLDRDVTHILEAMPKDAEQEAEYMESGAVIPFHEINHHPGAGVGLIGAAGTSMNHVVAVEWSPSGLGRNRRPVLGVLTGCGSLAIYGEGSALPFGSTVRPLRSVATKGKGAVRDLASWIVLWAVGENFVVPGQEEYGYGEFVKAFSWSQEIGPGKALLGYMNDLREVVILYVGTEYRKTKEEGLEEALWNVQEVCRFEVEAPHGQQDINDPDYVPGGSSFCIRWSPWIHVGDTWTCAISYMERNYVGFRRVTLKVPGSKPSEIPKVTVDTNDWDGRCIHLGSDAFLEFENMVWTVSDTKLCRGFIATPLIAVPFEVDLARANPNRPKSEHSTDQCMTSLPNHDVITNPITGLVVHPAELQTVSPSLVPSYTAVRLSATATNPGWWESNLTSPGDQDGEPQWVAEIQQKISSMLPQGLAGRVGIFGDDGEDGEDGVEPDDGAAAADAGLDNYDNDGAGSEESSDDGTAPGDGYVGPDVYPHRMRIWGLAISPGGGSTAVLATSQLTQNPERGGWHSHRSRVMFGYTEHGSARSRLQQQLQLQQQQQQQQRPLRQEELLDPSLGGTGIAEDDGASSADRLTTEARLWEWMYGGGPGVPGITHYAYPAASAGDGTISPSTAAQEARDALAQARRDRVREIFRPFAEGQTCGICDDGRSRFWPVPGAAAAGEEEDQLRQAGGAGGALGGQLDCVCENGHRVAVCGASGLAIGEPGISRCCGVCRSRCTNLEFLVEKVLLPAGKADEAEVVRRHVAGDVCVRCGGKYLD